MSADRMACRQLHDLGLSAYLPVFVTHGFCSWSDILLMTDEDMEMMGLPLSDRRRLLQQTRACSAEQMSDNSSPAHYGAAPTSIPLEMPRRKYKRHPKPDPNAPERPKTAYVRFAMDRRKELERVNLSFSDIAKRIGIDWQELDPTRKGHYLREASHDWTHFRREVNSYRGSDKYAQYAAYLSDFARRHKSSADAPGKSQQASSSRNDQDALGQHHAALAGSTSDLTSDGLQPLDRGHMDYPQTQPPSNIAPAPSAKFWTSHASTGALPPAHVTATASDFAPMGHAVNPLATSHYWPPGHAPPPPDMFGGPALRRDNPGLEESGRAELPSLPPIDTYQDFSQGNLHASTLDSPYAAAPSVVTSPTNSTAFFPYDSTNLGPPESVMFHNAAFPPSIDLTSDPAFLRTPAQAAIACRQDELDSPEMFGDGSDPDRRWHAPARYPF